MPLAGLILTDEDTLAPDAGVRALMPIAGQTLIEYQVRIARACGAAHIVVLVDRVPAPLEAAFERLRLDGITFEVVRNASQAADCIHPEEELLVMAAGIVAARGIVDHLATKTMPTVVTLPDTDAVAHFERIDGTDRWAGLALLNGRLLRETAAMLGDWTLGPTLLRMALQKGVERMPADGSGLSLVRTEQEAMSVAQELAGRSRFGGGGFWQTQIVDPVVRRVLPQLLGQKVTLELLTVFPGALMAAAMLAGALGWISASFGLFLLAGFPMAAAGVLGDIAARSDRALRWTADAKLPLLLALLGFAGWALDGPGLGWGPLVLALWAGIALILQPRTDVREAWIADADIIAVEVFMASLIGQPVLGLMIAVFHSVLSQFWLVRRQS
ncbi:MAG: hypothetical protein U1E64_08675 [Sphingomonadaceae bacterium]